MIGSWLIPLVLSSVSPLETAPSQETRPEITLEVVASGLSVPWGLAFSPDGTLFFTERAGRIRVIENGKLREEPWATIDVTEITAAGLTGIALSPEFEDDSSVFVLATFRNDEGALINKLLRIREEDGSGGEPTVVLDNIPSKRSHAGGGLAFGPDGLLYLAVGDTENLEAVQDPNDVTGKILRLNPDGSIPEDNPRPDSPIYALGLRNVQGFAWHPESEDLFATEHGPSNLPEENGREDHDELNVILPGENYGWPLVAGIEEDDRFVLPIADWTPAVAPCGLAIMSDERSPWYGDLFVACLRGVELRRVAVEPAENKTGWKVREQQSLFKAQMGRIRGVCMGPDGWIYFTNSNRDRHGSPGQAQRGTIPEDDRIFRMKFHR